MAQSETSDLQNTCDDKQITFDLKCINNCIKEDNFKLNIDSIIRQLQKSNIPIETEHKENQETIPTQIEENFDESHQHGKEKNNNESIKQINNSDNTGIRATSNIEKSVSDIRNPAYEKEQSENLSKIQNTLTKVENLCTTVITNTVENQHKEKKQARDKQSTNQSHEQITTGSKPRRDSLDVTETRD
ncbi:unnamed protein product [Mytilus coruscus]|uniref:Uncharacterized protein n=1 Tax=Mytilus coruscus TaxID=42192 RepID=A0A6J8C6B5_MYTCO|nr:unnamed protein product [Mytilus coruscus]